MNATTFNVKDLVSSACDTVSPLIQEGVELKQDVEEGIGEANTDKARVQQMVINLLSNAIKFTDSGVIIVRGTAAPLDITLPSASAKATADRSADPLGDTDRERNANADRLSAGVSADSPPAEELVISVSDAGKGIPAEELPTLFDEYPQVEGSESSVQREQVWVYRLRRSLRNCWAGRSVSKVKSAKAPPSPSPFHPNIGTSEQSSLRPSRRTDSEPVPSAVEVSRNDVSHEVSASVYQAQTSPGQPEGATLP